MLFDYEVLKLIWWVLVGVLLIGFAVTDGFDMGATALLPLLGKTDTERRVVINTVGPHWEGNQVWFITAGGAIFAAWPAVYAAAFSGFYWAMLLVLFALFFRPVGFDYRSKIEDPRWRTAWDWGLFAGGAIPALVFGVAFGNLLLGVPFSHDEFLRPSYDGNLFGLLNPFGLLTGVVSLSMLAMHGAVWVNLRSEGTVSDRARRMAQLCALIALATFALAGIWLSMGIDGYRIVSQPALDALPNPLAKEVIKAEGAWLSNYSNYPITMLAPALGFLGLIGTFLLAGAKRPGLAFVTSSLAMAGHHPDRRGFHVPLRHAVQPVTELQPDPLGCGVQSDDTDRHDLGGDHLRTHRAGLYRLVLPLHVESHLGGLYRPERLFELLRRDDNVVLCLDSWRTACLCLRHHQCDVAGSPGYRRGIS